MEILIPWDHENICPIMFVIALSVLVSASFFIYWLRVMGECFRIVEHFGGFLVCSRGTFAGAFL